MDYNDTVSIYANFAPEDEKMTENKKQNAFVFYVRMLAYTLMALVLRALTLAPVACLFVFEGWQRWLAVLCPVLAVFVMLPLRASFAQAMMRKPRFFSFDDAFSFANYGEKLKQGILHAVRVVLWGIPMALLLAGTYYCYTAVDALTIFQTINELGNTCAQLLKMSTVNNFMLGAGAVGAVLALGVVVWLWGVVRCSANRYIWAEAISTDRIPRAEIRRRLDGRRLRQLGTAIINLILWIPFLMVIGCALKNTLSDVSTLLMMAITTGVLPKTDLMSAAAPVALAFVGLYLPLLPLRRWNTAAFAAGKPRAKAEKKAAA